MWRVRSWLFFMGVFFSWKKRHDFLNGLKICVFLQNDFWLGKMMILASWNLWVKLLGTFGKPIFKLKLLARGSYFLWKQAMEGCDALAIHWCQKILCHSFFDFQIPHVPYSSKNQPGAPDYPAPCLSWIPISYDNRSACDTHQKLHMLLSSKQNVSLE